MSSKRSKFEIWSEVLESCLKTPRTQTWLLRQIRLKTKTIKETLSFLLSRNLIVQIEEFENITYQTTSEGEAALTQYYNLIVDFFKIHGSE